MKTKFFLFFCLCLTIIVQAQTLSDSELDYYYADLVPEASYTKIARSGQYPGLVTYARTITRNGTAPYNPRYSFYTPLSGSQRSAVEIDPSAKRNRRFQFNGREMTILNPYNYGHYIIVDNQTGNEFLAGCLNEKVGNTIPVQINSVGTVDIEKKCNCPADTKQTENGYSYDPDLGNQRTIIFAEKDFYNDTGLGGMNTDYGLNVWDEEYPTRPWFNRWGWVVVAVATLVGGYVIYTLLKPAEKITKIYTIPTNPEDHNPNGTVLGGRYQTGSPPDTPIINTALDNGNFIPFNNGITIPIGN